MHPRVDLAIAAALLLASLHGRAAGAERPIVIELFTSEGCSSCPPADALVTELARRPDVLPLTFHITYWNWLGWTDPFSFAAATERQTRYSARLGAGPYTPELVVEGARALVGSDRKAVEAAIAEAGPRRSTAAPVALKRRGPRLLVTVGEGSGHGQIVLVGFDHTHRTAVGRGENSGRTLLETNIVRSIGVLGSWTGAALVFDSAVPPGEDAAVLLEATDGSIVGAASLSAGS